MLAFSTKYPQCLLTFSFGVSTPLSPSKLAENKKSDFFSFLLSLGIECTQLVLDFFFDFNRVFEIDDLWTNTLGGYLAWLLYKRLHKNKIRN
ncbi:VanZ family protein [Streptococcus mitis]|uniref:VanZ family protein n=1 Tax=Streptococcus mitis TaxID=28037 RepID=UPI0009B84D76|nr:VanZ family protein [Streptococcus mitis]